MTTGAAPVLSRILRQRHTMTATLSLMMLAGTNRRAAPRASSGNAGRNKHIRHERHSPETMTQGDASFLNAPRHKTVLR